MKTPLITKITNESHESRECLVAYFLEDRRHCCDQCKKISD